MKQQKNNITMKNLILTVSLVISSFVVGQNFKLSDTIGHTGDFYEWGDNWDLIKVADANKISDSIKCEFIQSETLKKLNKIRKESGMKPLIVDDRLKPAATHNAYYNRYCADNDIFQPGQEWAQQGKFTITHTQRVDIPNHEEILWPDQRIRLLEPNVFSEITEELTMSTMYAIRTYDFITDDILFAYKACDGHWFSLTKNPKWDCVYFYQDRVNGFCFIILGKYK
jgi:hypothetical protein